MLTFQQESIREIWREMDELLSLHYEEVALYKSLIKLEPMWNQYFALEDLGRFIIYTVRDDGVLVGYGAFFVTPHMHYGSTVVAMNDVLFIHPEYRKSTGGYRLIKFCDESLRQRGDIHKITWHVKIAKDWTKVLHKLGYADEEIMCGKMVGS
jgi:hypothetical protein